MDRIEADHSGVELAEASEGHQDHQAPAIGRRAAIGGALGGALALLARPDVAMAGGRNHPALGLLLRGRYRPVASGPDLGLSTVDLSDGSYSKTKIYPAWGVAGHTNVLKQIGVFYTQFSGNLCAYDLPGGAIAMRFTPNSNTVNVPDGHGGTYVQGTWELKIPEATGHYRSFVGGHNHMVDSLHLLKSGRADEFCVCVISRP